MTTKLFISRRISKKLNISINESKLLLDHFLNIIKTESKFKKIKLSGFGTFYTHTAPNRLGRNPKTLESYIIKSIKKLNYKASIKTKETLN